MGINDGPSQQNQNRQTPSNRTEPVLILQMNHDKLQPHEHRGVNGDGLTSASLHIKAENFYSL